MEKRTFMVKSKRIADQLIKRFGEEYLITTEPKFKNPGESVYIFHSTPELYSEFIRLIGMQEQIRRHRNQAIDEYFNRLDAKAEEGVTETVIAEPVTDTLSSAEPVVQDADIPVKMTAKSKRKGQGKRRVKG